MTKHSEHGEEVSGAGLFEDLASPSEAERARALARAGKRLQGQPRVLEPNRAQVELRASDLESLLGEDHRARLVWGYVERQNLSGLFDAIKARGAVPGRRAIDPRILFALWRYATLDGVGSGREVARLTREHDAYRWICGGVSVNYHALNDFRGANDALMDEVLSDNVAALASVCWDCRSNRTPALSSDEATNFTFPELMSSFSRLLVNTRVSMCSSLRLATSPTITTGLRLLA